MRLLLLYSPPAVIQVFPDIIAGRKGVEREKGTGISVLKPGKKNRTNVKSRMVACHAERGINRPGRSYIAPRLPVEAAQARLFVRGPSGAFPTFMYSSLLIDRGSDSRLLP